MDRKKAIEIVRKTYPHVGTNGSEFEAALRELVPELKESGDERIRKALVKTFEKKLEIGFEWTEFSIPNRSVLDWLERKKEQQPVHTAKEMWKEMRLEVYAQASGNRHEPNYSDDSTKMFSLCDIDEIFEKIGNSTVGSQPAESDEIKGGDFISDGKRTFLVLANVKERNLGETRSTFCEGRILGVDGVVYCDGGDFKKFKRATSDERAKFIHDLKVGVELKEQPAEWSEREERLMKALQTSNARIAELVEENYNLKETKQEWSEEDERNINTLISVIKAHYTDYDTVRDDYPINARELGDWLKSIRPQPKEEREPMEIKFGGKIYKVHGVRALPGGGSGYIIEDEPGHYDCIMNPEEVLGGGYGVKQNGSPYPTNEATFGYPKWKPSEEQMDALEHFIRSWGESGTMSPQNPILCAANSLLTDLKKLP